MSPDRLAVVRNYCHPVMSVEPVGHHKETGLLDLDDLKAKLTQDTAAVYFENPSYLGFIETQGEAISSAAHADGALSVVGVDPISLGVLKPPSRYGADIVCGDIQGLGNHMYYGGALGGFIATRDEEKFVMEYPSRLFGIARTSVAGEWGFGDVAYSRTSFDDREKGKEFVGTAAALYGIAAAVYLALMGPQGMRELGTHILQKARYAAMKLAEIPGVRLRFRFHALQGVRRRFQPIRVKASARSTNASSKRASSAARTSRENFPELAGCALVRGHRNDDPGRHRQAGRGLEELSGLRRGNSWTSNKTAS